MHFYWSMEFTLTLGAIKEDSMTNCFFVNVVLNDIMTASDCQHSEQHGFLFCLNASKYLNIYMKKLIQFYH